MNTPKRIDITPEELDALLQRVKDGRLEDDDYEIIKAMADTVSYLSQLSDEKASTIKKLLKMLSVFFLNNMACAGWENLT